MALAACVALLAGCPRTAPCNDIQTDNENCGACGHSCNGGECRAGVCQPVVFVSGAQSTAKTTFGGLAIDRDGLYWTDSTRGVVSVPRAGGMPYVVSAYDADLNGDIGGVAVQGADVFWVTLVSGLVSTSSKTAHMQAPIAVASGQETPENVAADDTTVYWTNWGDGTVMSAPRGGGPTSTIAMDQKSPDAIALDDDYVYWTESSGGTVNRAPKSGGAVQQLASDQAQVIGLAVDATNVYWATQTDGTIMKAGLPNGPPVALATGQSGVRAIAIDTDNVYWSMLTNQGVVARRVPIRGGKTDTLGVACDPKVCADDEFIGETFVVVDDESVYWTTANDIYRISKN